MSSAGFQARYPGECAACLGWFPQDTVVRYNDEGKIVHHPRCSGDFLDMDVVAGAACSDCHTIHQGECL